MWDVSYKTCERENILIQECLQIIVVLNQLELWAISVLLLADLDLSCSSLALSLDTSLALSVSFFH